jgi:hypothetical protein
MRLLSGARSRVHKRPERLNSPQASLSESIKMGMDGHAKLHWVSRQVDAAAAGS